MPTLETFIAGGATALTLSLFFLWLFLTEKIVPKGRLDEMKIHWDETKTALKDALVVIKQQNDGVQPLLISVKELIDRINTRESK